MAVQRRRPRGTGTVYMRNRDRVWVARYKGQVRYGKTRAEAVVKLAEMLPPGVDPEAKPRRSSEPLSDFEAARERGDHTHAQWVAKCAAAGYRCNYCRVQLHPSDVVRDHVIPVSRGGSNSIDNVVPACASCNQDKWIYTAEEYFARLAAIAAARGGPAAALSGAR